MSSCTSDSVRERCFVSLAACGLHFIQTIFLKGRQMSSVADTTPNGAPNNFQFLGRAEHTRVLTAKTRFCHTYEGSVREREPGDFSSISRKWRLPPLPQYSAVQYHRRCCLSALCPLSAAIAPLPCLSAPLLSALSPARRRCAHRRPPRASDAFFSTQRPPLTHDYIKSMVSLIRSSLRLHACINFASLYCFT